MVMQWKLLTAMWDIARIEIRKVKNKNIFLQKLGRYILRQSLFVLYPQVVILSMVFGSCYFLVFLNTQGVHA